MKTYEVKCNDGVGSTDWGSVEIEAYSFTVEESGVLIFRDGPGPRVAAFASGQWISVRRLKCTRDVEDCQKEAQEVRVVTNVVNAFKEMECD